MSEDQAALPPEDRSRRIEVKQTVDEPEVRTYVDVADLLKDHRVISSFTPRHKFHPKDEVK